MSFWQSKLFSKKGTVSGGNNPRVSGTEFLFTSEHQQNYFFVVAKVFKGIGRPEGAVLQEGKEKSLTDPCWFHIPGNSSI